MVEKGSSAVKSDDTKLSILGIAKGELEKWLRLGSPVSRFLGRRNELTSCIKAQTNLL